MAGWNRPSADQPVKKGGAKAPSAAVWAVVIAGVLCLIALVCVFMQGGKEGEDSTVEKRVGIQSVKPKAQKSAAKKGPKTGGGAKVSGPSKARMPPTIPRTRENVAPPVPLEEVVEKVHPLKKFRFSSETEKYISMAIPPSIGGTMPPIPIPDDEDFTEDMKKAFAAPIRAEEGDDEEILRQKLVMLEAKDELQELAVKEGWTLQKFVNALRDKFEADSQYIAECYQTVQQAYSDPSIDDASYVAIRDKVNETLKERGLPEVLAYEEDEEAQKNTAEALANEQKKENHP